MSAPRPTIIAAPNNRSTHTDRRISTCKTCWHGIYEGQPTTWSTNPNATGLIHANPEHCR